MMNDYQMTSLANDRRQQLMGEAQQHRLARRAQRPANRRESVRPRSGLRLSLEFLFGKTAA